MNLANLIQFLNTPFSAPRKTLGYFLRREREYSLHCTHKSLWEHFLAFHGFFEGTPDDDLFLALQSCDNFKLFVAGLCDAPGGYDFYPPDEDYYYKFRRNARGYLHVAGTEER